MGSYGYFERHWRGDLSLAMSFWINHVFIGCLGSVLAISAVGAIKRRMGEDPLLCFGAVAAVLAAWVWLQAWQIGGTWRAASYAGWEQAGSSRARRVQTLLTLSVIVSAWLVWLSLAPVAQAALAGKPVPVLGSIVRESGRAIDFSGPITNELADAFARLLQTMQPNLVRLESNGGSVGAARAMAALIRVRGLSTEVSGRCASACTIVFFAGRERRLVGAGVLGFHSYSSAQSTPQAVLKTEDWDRRTFLAGGVKPAFVEHIFSVPPAQMWFPTLEEVTAAGFATGR